jgi:Protein kinase domain
MLVSCFPYLGGRLVGKTVSPYRMLSELGRGGMGIVYAAEDTLLGRRAALKFLPEEGADEAQSLARFQREARAASSLNHPNICTIYEIGKDQGRWFIAMELLEGQPLDSPLPSGGTPIDKLLDWAIQIGDTNYSFTIIQGGGEMQHQRSWGRDRYSELGLRGTGRVVLPAARLECTSSRDPAQDPVGAMRLRRKSTKKKVGSQVPSGGWLPSRRYGRTVVR